VNNAPGSDSNSQPSKEGQTLASPAFREFLGFLELGCAGNAVEGYQLVLVVVAGIPEAVSPYPFFFRLPCFLGQCPMMLAPLAPIAFP